jgi:aldehyde:ferredoxin oxidoreductase
MSNFGRILRIDLTNRKTDEQRIEETILRKYIGGLGVGARFLYDEMSPKIEWSDPKNLLIFGTGPLNGTGVAGSGGFCVVTKGCLTNGATSSQAMGNFGAFLRSSGFETIVMEGASSQWCYLYIHDRVAELGDATHLIGKDTWETEELLKRELNLKGKQSSVFSIGPAGENLVRFAAIVGDQGHVAAHNGVGAVMGSKKLKAVVVSRGKQTIPVSDKKTLSLLNHKMIDAGKNRDKATGLIYQWGTSFLVPGYILTGLLPVKNLTTSLSTDYSKFAGEYYRPRFKLKRNVCLGCPTHHLHIVEVTEGPYAGYVGEEPDYECMAAWGPLMGQTDPGAAVMLSDIADRMGMDSNEAGWLISLVMECFEKGMLSKGDTDGLDMTWGNVEATKAMLERIAHRSGFGNLLAEGVMRFAQHLGGEAPNMGVFLKKGHAPRGHDHRARWTEILDAATSSTGTIETGPITVDDPLSPEKVVDTVARKKVRSFVDSLVVCAFPTMTMLKNEISHLVDMLNAVTAWDYTKEEALEMEMRVVNLLRVFNVRHGIGPETEMPSPRYGSAPVDGPVSGKSIQPHWEKMLEEYYKIMGWDRKTGKPWPETLRKLGLEHVVKDIWITSD